MCFFYFTAVFILVVLAHLFGWGRHAFLFSCVFAPTYLGAMLLFYSIHLFIYYLLLSDRRRGKEREIESVAVDVDFCSGSACSSAAYGFWY